jgi:hypothetical protein
VKKLDHVNVPAIQTCAILREILIHVYCAHPAVLRLHGWNYNRSSRGFLIATEFMQHGDAAHFFTTKRTASLTPTQRQILMYGGARALEWCHARRILHRDIKLENIMLDEHKRPRIGDFGMAKMSVNDEQTMRQGSPIYMAPELLTQGAWSFPADVYAFGIACAMIAVNAYWQPRASSFPQLSNLIRTGVRPSLVGVPQKLAYLIQRMFDGIPDQRPLFSEVAKSLEDQEYWLSDVNTEEFQAYATWLREEQARTAAPPKGLATCLDRAIKARALIARIEPFGCTNPEERLTALIACLASDDPASVEALHGYLRDQLAENGNFMRVIAQLADTEELIPEDDSDDEADDPWPTEGACHFRIVRGSVRMAMNIFLTPDTTVAQLHETLGRFLATPVKIWTGKRQLAPDATDPITSFGIPDAIFDVTA